MGFLFVERLERLTISPVLRIGILTGFIGGFSTFSTFAMETLLLAEQGDAAKTVLYAVLSIILGMLATFGGSASLEISDVRGTPWERRSRSSESTWAKRITVEKRR
jgi:fluoride ion exporter CrcB/FEX